MRHATTIFLAALLAMSAGVSNAQNTGPTPDERAPTPIAADASTTTIANRASASASASETYTASEIAEAAGNFFGTTSGAMGGAVERIFREQGRPMGYIRGEEVSGSFGLGLRYGRGTLVMKDGQERPIYWQGPSIGLDAGGSASKVFTLVYNLDNPDGIYRRYPGVEGSAFFVAGISVTYQRAEGVTLAPMRTGLGLRAGVNAGYTAYSKRRRWFPL